MVPDLNIENFLDEFLYFDSNLKEGPAEKRLKILVHFPSPLNVRAGVVNILH
jgi:hypothetical protein